METRRIAIFDFDKTMVSGDSITDFVRFLWDHKLISLPQLVRILLVSLLWILHLQPVEKAKEQALSPLKKLDDKAASALCREFVEQNLVPRIFPPALDKMRAHHLAGDVVLLVSASPACYLSQIKHYLPVDAVLATTTDERYQVITNVRGQEKANQVKLWLESQGITPSWEESASYGDSRSDLPVMQLVGKPFWVNPSAAALKAAPHQPQLRWAPAET